MQESQCGWAQRKLGVPVCPQEQFLLQAAKDRRELKQDGATYQFNSPDHNVGEN